MLLPIAVTGCGQVLGIEGWTEVSSGGAGGTANSSTSSTAASGMASSSSGAGGMASASASSSGQGGQGTPASSSVGPGPASSSSAGGQGPSASSSAGTGGQGGSGGTVGFNEICDNGADDDFDGHIDCADTDCTMVGYRCAKQFPLPWKGPVVLYTGDFNSPVPPCGEGWSTPSDYMAGTLITGPVQCGSCTCGAVMGGQCVVPAGVGANVYSNTSCVSSPAAFTPLTQPNNCTFINVPIPAGSSYSVKLAGTAIFAGGSCAPMSGVTTIPPAYFSQKARICQRATMAEGCMTGNACTAPHPAQFKNAVCIYQDIDDTASPPFCPMPYGQSTMLYTTISDQRSCTACQCGGSTGACNTKLSLFFNDQACATPPFDLLPPDCGLLLNDGSTVNAVISVGNANGPACPPIPPVPMGTVIGTGRTQVCCTL